MTVLPPPVGSYIITRTPSGASAVLTRPNNSR